MSHDASLVDFANALRDVLGLAPLPHMHSKEAKPYKTVERQDLERFYVREVCEDMLYAYGAQRKRGGVL